MYIHIIYLTPSYNFKGVVGLMMGAEMAGINNEKNEKTPKNIYTSPNDARMLIWAIDMVELGSGRWVHCMGDVIGGKK